MMTPHCNYTDAVIYLIVIHVVLICPILISVFTYLAHLHTSQFTFVFKCCFFFVLLPPVDLFAS